MKDTAQKENKPLECNSFKEAIQQNQGVEHQLRCAMAMSGLGLWEWSIDSDEVFLSEELLKVLDISPKVFDGTMAFIISKIIHPDERLRMMKSMAQVRKEGTISDRPYRVNHSKKKECWVKSTSKVIFNKSGRAIRVIGTVVEVTDEYLMKRDLKTTLSFVEGIVETLPTPIFYKNDKGLYKYCNKAFLEFVGRERESVIGKGVVDVAPSEYAKEYSDADNAIFESKLPQHYEGKVLHKDGSLHTVLFSKAAHVGSNGDAKGLVGVMQDITNQKAIEREVQMLYKAKDVFLNVNRLMMTYKTEKEFFDSIQCRLQEVFEKADQSTVLQLNDDQNLTILINSGYDAKETVEFLMPLKESFMWKDTDGIIEMSHVINDIPSYKTKQSKKVISTESGQEVQSTLMIPLKIEGTLRWILSFDSNQNNVFDEIDQFVAEYIREELPIVYRMFELYQRTLKLSRYDGLTGLMNRRYFEFVFEEMINKAFYSGKPLVVTLFDLDGLKNINDTYGHHAGDAYIKGFVSALNDEFGETDSFARIGGDEFTGLFDKDDIAMLVNRIENTRKTFANREIPCEGISFRGSFSYGISIYPNDSKDMSQLLQIADDNMYKDKQRPR